MAIIFKGGNRLQGSNAERIAATEATTHLSMPPGANTNGASVRPNGNADRLEFVGAIVQSAQNGISVGSVEFTVGRTSSFTNGDAWCRIYEDDETTYHDSVHRDVDVIAVDTADPPTAKTTFTFSTPVTIQTDWIITFGGDFGSQGDYVSIGFGANYTDGYRYLLNNGTWAGGGDSYGTYMVVKGAAPTFNTEAGTIYEAHDTGIHWIWSGSAWNQMSG